MSTQPGCIRDHFFAQRVPDGRRGQAWRITVLGQVDHVQRCRALPPGQWGGRRPDQEPHESARPLRWGSWALELLALRLNRDYSCAGVFYDLGMASTETCYGDYVIPNSIECGSLVRRDDRGSVPRAGEHRRRRHAERPDSVRGDDDQYAPDRDLSQRDVRRVRSVQHHGDHRSGRRPTG